MVHALAVFWIAVTVLTTLSFTAIIDPSNSEVFAQGNNTTEEMVEYSNMTLTDNATLMNECEENATAEECDTGSISRRYRP